MIEACHLAGISVPHLFTPQETFPNPRIPDFVSMPGRPRATGAPKIAVHIQDGQGDLSQQGGILFGLIRRGVAINLISCGSGNDAVVGALATYALGKHPGDVNSAGVFFNNVMKSLINRTHTESVKAILERAMPDFGSIINSPHAPLLLINVADGAFQEKVLHNGKRALTFETVADDALSAVFDRAFAKSRSVAAQDVNSAHHKAAHYGRTVDEAVIIVTDPALLDVQKGLIAEKHLHDADAVAWKHIGRAVAAPPCNLHILFSAFTPPHPFTYAFFAPSKLEPYSEARDRGLLFGERLQNQHAAHVASHSRALEQRGGIRLVAA
jgi:hypothetical protein